MVEFVGLFPSMSLQSFSFDVEVGAMAPWHCDQSYHGSWNCNSTAAAGRILMSSECNEYERRILNRWLSNMHYTAAFHLLAYRREEQNH